MMRIIRHGVHKFGLDFTHVKKLAYYNNLCMCFPVGDRNTLESYETERSAGENWSHTQMKFWIHQSNFDLYD
jgi:hypothetical protein